MGECHWKPLWKSEDGFFLCVNSHHAFSLKLPGTTPLATWLACETKHGIVTLRGLLRVGNLTVATVWEKKKCPSFLAIVNHLYVYPSSEAKPRAPPELSSLPEGNISEPGHRRASCSNHTAALISTWQLSRHPQRSSQEDL